MCAGGRVEHILDQHYVHEQYDKHDFNFHDQHNRFELDNDDDHDHIGPHDLDNDHCAVVSERRLRVRARGGLRDVSTGLWRMSDDHEQLDDDLNDLLARMR